MMKMKLAACTALATLLAGGCSSNPGPTEPDFERAARYDIEKIREVNKSAYTRGVHVEWVNLPQAKRTLEPITEEQSSDPSE